MIASRPIAKGGEIFNQYAPNEIHRPDKSFFNYGFVSLQEHPLLCVSDLPAGVNYKSSSDSLYEGAVAAHGCHALAFPTRSCQLSGPCVQTQK